jgi:hypothetical protein
LFGYDLLVSRELRLRSRRGQKRDGGWRAGANCCME